MNQGKAVFQQLLETISRYDFEQCVERYQGSKGIKTFSCWDQFLCMLFAQLTSRSSLRDTVACLRSQQGKLYHVGIKGKISLNTLSNANCKRDWKIYRDFAQKLISKAQKLYKNEDLGFNIEESIYAFDSSTIELCLSMCPWAKFSHDRAAIKLHTLLDLRGNIPCFIRLTEANLHDMNVMDELLIEAGAYYIMDRGYMDFKRLFQFNLSKAFFVVREKRVAKYNRIESRVVDKSTGLRCDQTVVLKIKKSRKRYPDQFRRISFYDSESLNTLTFITNNFNLSALTIAELYKSRWKVELFFKWIKQHLQIKTFFGLTENAVKTQIWIAISAYLLVAIAKKEQKIEKSFYTMLQVISISIFDKTPIKSMLNSVSDTKHDTSKSKQLDLFNI